MYGKVTPGKVLRPKTTTRGYLRLTVSVDGRVGDQYVHRIVAETYIPNPEGKPQVNHINGDKRDNRVENLEWCTAKENTAHAIRTGLSNPRGGSRTGCHGTYWYTDGSRRETQHGLCKKYGVLQPTLRYRLARGQDINQALGLTEKRWAPCD